MRRNGPRSEPPRRDADRHAPNLHDRGDRFDKRIEKIIEAEPEPDADPPKPPAATNKNDPPR